MSESPLTTQSRFSGAFRRSCAQLPSLGGTPRLRETGGGSPGAADGSGHHGLAFGQCRWAKRHLEGPGRSGTFTEKLGPRGRDVCFPPVLSQNPQKLARSLPCLSDPHKLAPADFCKLVSHWPPAGTPPKCLSSVTTASPSIWNHLPSPSPLQLITICQGSIPTPNPTSCMTHGPPRSRSPTAISELKLDPRTWEAQSWPPVQVLWSAPAWAHCHVSSAEPPSYPEYCSCPLPWPMGIVESVGSDGKESTCSAGDPGPGRSLGREDPLEKGMATHSTILPWRIPRTEEPGGRSWTVHGVWRNPGQRSLAGYSTWSRRVGDD